MIDNMVTDVPNELKDKVVYVVDGAISDGAKSAKRLIHLSHWKGNQTPPEYKDNTSTEICYKYMEKNFINTKDAVITNNHIDIDGVLSAFVLSNYSHAKKLKNFLIRISYLSDFSYLMNRQDLKEYHEIKSIITNSATFKDAHYSVFDYLRGINISNVNNSDPRVPSVSEKVEFIYLKNDKSLDELCVIGFEEGKESFCWRDINTYDNFLDIKVIYNNDRFIIALPNHSGAVTNFPKPFKYNDVLKSLKKNIAYFKEVSFDESVFREGGNLTFPIIAVGNFSNISISEIKRIFNLSP